MTEADQVEMTLEDRMRPFFLLAHQMTLLGLSVEAVTVAMLGAAVEAHAGTAGGPHATVAWLRQSADAIEAKWSAGPRAV